jgi:hypothetical protein
MNIFRPAEEMSIHQEEADRLTTANTEQAWTGYALLPLMMALNAVTRSTHKNSDRMNKIAYISAPVQIGPAAHPASSTVRLFPGSKADGTCH